MSESNFLSFQRYWILRLKWIHAIKYFEQYSNVLHHFKICSEILFYQQAY